MIDPKIIDLLLSSEPANNELGRIIGNNLYKGQFAPLFDEWVWAELYKVFINLLQTVNERLNRYFLHDKAAYMRWNKPLSLDKGCELVSTQESFVWQVFTFGDKISVGFIVDKIFEKMTYHRPSGNLLVDHDIGKRAERSGCFGSFHWAVLPEPNRFLPDGGFAFFDKSQGHELYGICYLIHNFYHLKSIIKFVP